MKVNVYIDGFNLYYGMLKGTPYKWLDLEKFSDSMVSHDIEVVTIKYFTAPIKAYPPNPDKLLRQHFYIEALSALPRVKVIEGFYTKHKVKMPFYKEPCISCPESDGMASVVKLEEKRSDVNIATEMLLDATLENEIDPCKRRFRPRWPSFGDSLSPQTACCSLQPSSGHMRRIETLCVFVSQYPSRPSCKVSVAR